MSNSTSGSCVDCVAEKRERPNKAHRQDRCGRHYVLAMDSGAIGRKRRATGAPATECAVEDCAKDVKANGLCASHNARARRGADLEAPFRGKRADQCSFEGCENPEHGRGLCGGHYRQQLDGKPLAPLRVFHSRDGECGVESCTKPIAHGGLCTGHYNRKRNKTPNWDAPLRPKAPNGAGHLDAAGYRMVTVTWNGKKRKMGEHILLAEQILGRDLVKGENVHHKNGSRADNRTGGPFVLTETGRLLSGNLEIWSTRQPAGQEIGPKVEWALELLETYLEFLRPQDRAAVRSLSARMEGDGGESVAA